MSSHTCPNNKAVVRDGAVRSGCEQCLPQQLQRGDSAGFNRRWQQSQYRQELTQPNMPREFIKAYPDIAREKYDEETYRKFS